MLLTISTTHQPASDLGFLLMKHPDNVHAIDLPFGRATLFFSEASDQRCTAAMMLEVDPVELVRGKNGAPGQQDQYVNDRPYAASSLLAVALGRMLNTAMAGRSKLRQELADSPMPLEATITPLPARGGPDLVRRLFAPLGYEVEATPILLDPAHPEWGDSHYVALRLTGQVRLADLLTHIFVLVPALDGAKHYYIGEDEVEKLLRKGDGWLDSHPERDTIVRRYLKGFRSLMRLADASFEESVDAEPAEMAEVRNGQEEAIEAPIRLNDIRIDHIVATLVRLGAGTVLDCGCGEGKLLRALLKVRGFTRIVGMEVAPRVLASAGDRLRIEELPDMQRKRLELVQGSLTYRDDRLQRFDAATVIEVIEHMDAERLPAFEQALFGHARPSAIIVTTPNREHNALFAGLAEGKLRHPDHRFEWTRDEFRHWAEGVAQTHGYSVEFEGIGAVDAQHGAPTQMGVFTR